MNAPAGQGAGLLDSIDRSQAERRHGNTSNKEIDDSSQADELPLSADDEVSKWKLKGKRNVRRVSKRSSYVTDNGDEMNEETYLEMQGNTFDHRISRLRVNYRQSNDFNSYLGGDDSFDRDYWIPGSALGNKRYSTLRHMPRGRSNNSNDHFVDWDDMALEHRTPLNGYLVKTRDYYSSDYHGQAYVGHDRLGGRRRNMLFEVDLKVQSSYPKQRVPIISLMSKIDGRAIIGHSLQIEELQEGSSDTLFSKRSEFGYGRFLGEIDYALPSVWRTARRTTNYHVPFSPAVDSGGDVDYLSLGRKPASMDLNASLGNLMEKIDPCALRPPATKKPTKKYSKKVSMSSSQKTRTLSSFCVDQHEQIGHGRHDDVEAFCLSELIKSESGTSTATCCIPVKLVFRRLYEAVGRPPEAIPPPPIHEALPNKNNQIQQSCT